jgi:hypothetical protein
VSLVGPEGSWIGITKATGPIRTIENEDLDRSP